MPPRRITVFLLFFVIVPSLLGSNCKNGPPTPIWTRTLDESNEPGAYGGITKLIPRGNGFVAIGGVTFGGANTGRPAVWTSPDGRSWTRSPDDPAIFPSGATLTGITTHGSLLVMTGVRPGAVAGYTGTAWTSPDGVTWTVANDFGPDAYLRAVVSTGSELIAVGTFHSDVAQGRHGTVWRSTDPTAQLWAEVFRQGLDPIGSPPMNRGSEMWDVLATSPPISDGGGPRFIAVGSRSAVIVVDGDRRNDEDAAVWGSLDGTTWTLLSTYDPVFALMHSGTANLEQQYLVGVMQGAAALYVAGRDGGEYSNESPNAAMIWHSVDKGITWTRLTDADPSAEAAFPVRHAIYDIESFYNPGAFGYGEMAVGTQAGSGPKDGLVWRGATGFPRWHQMSSPLFSGPGNQVIQGIAHGEDIIVVGGGAWSGVPDEGRVPAIWTLARP